MSARVTHPTPYPDVNAVLRVLLSGVQTILGSHFVGLYLCGSLAGGDFDPQRSDIDFVVVTSSVLPDGMIQALEALHARITASGSTPRPSSPRSVLSAAGLKWATKLEGSYVPQPTLRRHDLTDAPCPCINEGRFHVGSLGSDWVIQRHIIREQGIVVAGPPPQTLIDPVQPDDLRQAVLGFLCEWWAPMLHNPDPRLHGGEYQAYAILTMCRALYTLQHGIVVSKPVAARWAQEVLGERWAAVIERASAWRHDAPAGNTMDEALGFIRYTLERTQHYEIPAKER